MLKKYLILTLTILSPLLTSACSVFGKETVETLSYTTLQKDGAFELREYAPFIIAETTVNQMQYEDMSGVAFNRLFQYISGANEGSQKIEMTAPVLMERKGEKIAMTAPVLMQEKDNGWSMAFTLPSSYTMETAPVPTNTDITLSEVKGWKVAALQFSGVLNNKSIAHKTAELQNWVTQKELKETGAYRAAGYNPPFTIPALRRNEILVPVE